MVSFIRPIDSILSSVTTPGQSGVESDCNEGVLCISQRSSITGASPSDSLVSYAGHSLGGGSLTPLQRISRCIVRSHLTGQCIVLNLKPVLFPIIQFSKSTQFRSQNSSILNNSVALRSIQFSISTQFRFVWGGVLLFCRNAVGVFYSPRQVGHSLGKSYSSAEMQSVYSTAPDK